MKISDPISAGEHMSSSGSNEHGTQQTPKNVRPLQRQSDDRGRR